MVTGLMLLNVCIMDRQHGPVQLELIDQDHSEITQHTGSYRCTSASSV